MIKQAGVTLLELVIGLAILGTVMVGISQLIKLMGEDTQLTLAAQQVKVVGEAAQAYIRDNYSAVIANATASTPALIRVSDLIANGNLSTGYSSSNTFNQTMCVLVLEPTTDHLVALVVAEGGTTIDDISLGGIAGYIGAAGGGIYTSAPTIIRGSVGGYSLAIGNFGNANHLGQKCDGSSGAVSLTVGHPVQALWFADGDSTSAFLYRNSIPGRPELNRMNTDIDMNNNDISNVATVQINTIVTNGTACTTNGVVARDATGAVMSCQNLTWQPQGSAYWKDPVSTKAALNTIPCDASTAWQTRIVQTPSVGTGPRAYTCNGSSWMPLAVDDSGNLTVTGTLSLGKALVNDVVTEGSACTPNGLVARDSVGLILSCQSSLWAKASGESGGLKGLLSPKAGKTISCSTSGAISVTYYAYVDATNTPYTRVYSPGNYDSGWVAGFTASGRVTNFNFTAVWDPAAYSKNLTGTYTYTSTTTVCTASFPFS
ncbi:shufflon system plasmid conjugative transfer pilus tip adhesin PilV [Methylovorus glucosotrophus]|uniref:Bacterial shufflon protein N-terminal domain-containing protein n=1 Tax=Methylovorus glucosotrophus (strain SIP3-4) TaxID=582744 RepID=C6XET8_METGS|nr:shufflon system plasmid conjugative transfer pilus tip adhesin PilV [Methylovorus glucosotrophus]ACT52145.1 hypothetical protein Msip34_2921 [Methylovorus glucosotrophus SIP3-4]